MDPFWSNTTPEPAPPSAGHVRTPVGNEHDGRPDERINLGRARGFRRDGGDLLARQPPDVLVRVTALLGVELEVEKHD